MKWAKDQTKPNKLDDQPSQHTDYTGNLKSKYYIEGKFIFDYMSKEMLSKIFDILVNYPVSYISIQMDVIQNTPNLLYFNDQELSHECYCPCGEVHSTWLDNMKIKDHIIEESPCQKLCQTNKFNNLKEILKYLTGKAQASSPSLVHNGLFVYLEQLYPEQKLKIKMQNSKNIEKQNNYNKK